MFSVLYPNYEHSILNIANSILAHYQAPTLYPTIPVLDKELNKSPKNVILWILDGMGVDLLKKTLPENAFLRKHLTDKITSVFPPTTATATTTFYSALPPIVHGWAGWSPYFKQADKCIELFTGKDTYTKEKTEIDPTQILPYSHLFNQIEQTDKTITCTQIFPQKVYPDGARYFCHQCSRILKQTKKSGRQFILAYWADPDHTCHHKGTYTTPTKRKIKSINAQIEELSNQLTDTLIIISADHGHIPIDDFFYIDEYPDFESCFKTPLTLDDRVSAIFLKQGKEQTFLELFNTYLKDDFILIKSEDALKKGLFGHGSENPYIRDFLGDYLIIGIGHRVLRQNIPNCRPMPEFKSSHAGLSPQEMLVPLIIIKKT